MVESSAANVSKVSGTIVVGNEKEALATIARNREKWGRMGFSVVEVDPPAHSRSLGLQNVRRYFALRTMKQKTMKTGVRVAIVLGNITQWAEPDLHSSGIRPGILLEFLDWLHTSNTRQFDVYAWARPEERAQIPAAFSRPGRLSKIFELPKPN